MTDLVDKLLAAIQEREDVAKAARQRALSSDWRSVVDAGSGVSHVESRKGALIADGDLFEVGPHVALHDPASALLLCQAHREIIRQYRYAWDRRNSGTPEERQVWQVRTIAMIDVVSALARGYGIEMSS